MCSMLYLRYLRTDQKKNNRRTQREVLELEQCRRGPRRSSMPHLRYLMTDQQK